MQSHVKDETRYKHSVIYKDIPVNWKLLVLT